MSTPPSEGSGSQTPRRSHLLYHLSHELFIDDFFYEFSADDDWDAESLPIMEEQLEELGYLDNDDLPEEDLEGIQGVFGERFRHHSTNPADWDHYVYSRTCQQGL
jgi:hypothetical protein